MNFEIKKARFDRICADAMRERHVTGEDGVGTLKEKRLHAAIKRYLCEDEAFHEVGIAGTRYVSDVRVGNDAYEVQTGSFYPMRQKIAYYLEHTDLTVTVVHPISVIKWMCKIDTKTSEVSPRRRVPRSQRREDLLAELYSLRSFLGHPRLKFCLLLLETQDFRLIGSASGDKARGTKYERVPISLVGEETFECADDFRALIPKDLPKTFTVKQFAAATKLRSRDAYAAAHVLCDLGLTVPAPPVGKAMAFTQC